jgi:glyoxylate reductase
VENYRLSDPTGDLILGLGEIAPPGSIMSNQKTFLLLGQLPSSALFASIQAKYSITHIPVQSIPRSEIISQIAALPTKSFTAVLVFADAPHLKPLDKELFAPLSIEIICRAGAGYDTIDVEYFTSRGTWVANSPNAVKIPTAEWCVSLILATVKGLHVADKTVRAGHWRENLGLQNNVSGMTLGVVGLGAIGKVCHFKY